MYIYVIQISSLFNFENIELNQAKRQTEKLN